MKNYIGRKCKGFRFEDLTDDVRWLEEKESLIGKIGVITENYDYFVSIKFDGMYSYYPISLIEEHLIPEGEANPPRFCEVHSEPLNNREMETYIGRKCKGFRFKSGISASLAWSLDMKKHIGEIGEIDYQKNDRVRIRFQKKYAYFYPLSLIEEHLIPEGEDNSHGFCETPEEKCTMNYCDDNGCQNRKRELVEEPNPVNHPQHYGGEDNVYEAIKVIEAWDLGFNLGNTVKYIARCGKKDDELQELKKASWYLQRQIAKLENAKSSK